MSTSLESVNKRLDEWVPEERMDFSKAELPRKDAKTPRKEVLSVNKLTNGSQPASPEVICLWHSLCFCLSFNGLLSLC